jgi:cytochrome c553
MRALLIALAVALGLTPAAARTAPQPPRLLSQTGLYSAPGVVDARHLAYAPQYPLWTDGAAKARWLHLPAGAAIDGRDEDGWVFPVGTKAWKEFAFQGRKVETRLLWKTGPKTWAFASYAWNADQSDAVLVPEAGLPDAAEVAPGVRHSIPSRSDCRSCHGQEQVEVLGFTALQLSPDRDPGAIHGEPLQPGMVTLRDLVARRLLRGARPDLLSRPPRIQAATPATRAALGYLAANCGACHRADRPLPGLDLDFRHTSRIAREAEEPGLRTTLRRPSLYQASGTDANPRLQPGDPGRSTLLHRMASRRPTSQMPPLGSALVDQEAVTRLSHWIADLPLSPSH